MMNPGTEHEALNKLVNTRYHVKVITLTFSIVTIDFMNKSIITVTFRHNWFFNDSSEMTAIICNISYVTYRIFSLPVTVTRFRIFGTRSIRRSLELDPRHQEFHSQGHSYSMISSAWTSMLIDRKRKVFEIVLKLGWFPTTHPFLHSRNVESDKNHIIHVWIILYEP